MRKTKQARKTSPDMWTDEELEKINYPRKEYVDEDGNVQVSRMLISIPETELSLRQRFDLFWEGLVWSVTPKAERARINAEIQLEEKARRLAHAAWRERQTK